MLVKNNCDIWTNDFRHHISVVSADMILEMRGHTLEKREEKKNNII
jgi:hypothetical protein